jgi:NaMN:DMB phosphoribosyltransferase
VQQLAGRLPEGRRRFRADAVQLRDLPKRASPGTAYRFDPAAGRWIPLGHPVITTGMDYIGGFSDARELPKGKQVTLKYRVALDASMTDGKGRCDCRPLVKLAAGCGSAYALADLERG